MTRNFLASIGMLIMTVLVLAGVALIALYYDSIGLIDLPLEQVKQMVQLPVMPLSTEKAAPKIATIESGVIGVATAEWSNPLDLLPTATLKPEPTPTLTPIPRLSTEIYQAETIDRLKALAASLQRWLDLNNRLAGDNSLKDDPSWQSEVSLVLQDIQMSGHRLGEVGPPPEEYESIDSWLNQIPDEVDGLKDAYERGLANEDPSLFLQAGDHFTRIKEDLAHAVEAMLAQNWVIQ